LTRFYAGKLENYTTHEGLSSDTVLSIGEDRDGGLWIGTASGISRWDQGKFIAYSRSDGLLDEQINAVHPTRMVPLLIATSKGLCEFKEGRFVSVDLLASETPAEIYCFQEDRDGTLWIGDSHGLRCLRRPLQGDPIYASEFASLGVRAICIGDSGEIWFGTRAGELNRFQPGEHESFAAVAHFSPHAILAVCEDREGNLWVGTAGGGLARLKVKSLAAYPIEEEHSRQVVLALCEGPTGEIWVATDKGGLWHGQAGALSLFYHDQFANKARVRALCLSRDGSLWIGTINAGLFRWRNGQMTHYSPIDGLSDSSIEALYEGRDRTLWIATCNGGLNRLKGDQIVRLNTPWGFSGNFAIVLLEDRQGRLWIGTSGDGLFCLSDGDYAAYNQESGFPSNFIRTLYEDDQGAIWIGTSSGLVRSKAGRWTIITSQNGLEDEVIAQFQADHLGNFWIGSSRGLYRVKQAELNDFAEAKKRFVHSVPYGKSDGMPSLDCAAGFQPASCRTRDGQLWFATDRGLVRVHPAILPWNKQPPPVVLEQVLVDDVALRNGDWPGSLPPKMPATPVVISPDKQRVELQYAGLSLVAPEKVRFRYQLQGFDDDWIEARTSRSARYTKIPPGRYQFRVSACNNDGVWNETGASVAIVVLPQFWQTWWFKLTGLVSLGGLLAGIYQVRVAKRRDIESLRIRIARDLHDEIGSSLWSISLLSQMLQKPEVADDEKQRELAEINRIARQTAHAIRHIVWLINPEYDTVQDLLLRMKDFATTILSGLNYHFEIGVADLAKKLSLNFRQNLFLLFKEALTNIVKHAQASVVHISLSENRGAWQLQIRDNGVGFDPTRISTGNGLKNLRLRAAQLGGNLEVQSQLGQGTSLIIRVKTR
jgi:ligand-binding sensor domain-containing protein/two-component sensor histidine kinase